MYYGGANFFCKKITILGVYVNSYQQGFGQEMSTLLLSDEDTSILLLGDYNAVLDEKLYRSEATGVNCGTNRTNFGWIRLILGLSGDIEEEMKGTILSFQATIILKDQHDLGNRLYS